MKTIYFASVKIIAGTGNLCREYRDMSIIKVERDTSIELDRFINIFNPCFLLSLYIGILWSRDRM